ncbi:MAG: hypothetical protein OXG44_16195 [Gammaproteobacteria bacterium]|nr:hypothetical protein [Gammaproteobacteria bacterium]MDE0190543.1 hypothetical protein [Gammaproteobacteria bacterium]
MSVRVLVIPEDPTHNGYILKPLVGMVLADVGKSTAKVTLLTNPRLRGYDQALDAIRNNLASKYGFFDLWLFFPDADRATAASMQALEDDLAQQGVSLLCCSAIPEVEIYACVADRSTVGLSWAEVRTHARMKEEVFAPLLDRHGDPRRPGGGRREMTVRSIANSSLFFALCPEVAELRNRIRTTLN